ncbi:MAG: efflux RND transporter permease subunit [Treponema sp.]|nr:efflux RND transporter permease subunit [Candidatus Treponema merdequi]
MTKKIFILIIITTIFSYSLTKIQVGESEHSKYVTYSIKFEYYGIDPLKLEKLITIPLEEKISELNSLYEIKSTIQFNETITTASFYKTKDNNLIYQNINQITDDLYNKLQKNVQKPQIFGSDIQNKSVICISIDADKQYIEKNIKPLFEAIDGITEVNIAGGQSDVIELCYYPQKLSSLNLNPFDISDSINNINCDSLFLTNIDEQYENNFFFNNKPDSLKNFEENFISDKNIPLKNISELEVNSKTENELVLLNNKNAIFLDIKSNPDSNLIYISKKCAEILSSKIVKETNPIILYDKGMNQKQELISTAKTLLLTILISSLLIHLFFNNFRFLILSLIETLLTILWTTATFPFYNTYIIPVLKLINPNILYKSYILNSNSLAGLTLSIGLITDVLLITYELFNTCKNRIQFQKKFIFQIKSSIFSTVTTILAIIPLLFMNSITGGISESAFTIILMLIYSTILSLFFFPDFFDKKQKAVSNIFFLTAKKSILNFYTNCKVIKLIFYILTISSILFYIFSKKNIETINYSKIIYAQINFNPEKTKENILKESSSFINALQTITQIKFIKSEFLRGHAEIEIVYDNISEHNLVKIIKSKTDLITDGFIYFSESASNKKEIPVSLQFTITGDNEAECRKIAYKAASLISENNLSLQTVLNFNDEEKLYLFTPDQNKLSKLKIPISHFAELLRFYIFSPVISKYFINSQETDIKLKNTSTINTDNIQEIQVVSSIPIKEMGKLTVTTIPSRIYRNNCRPCAYFSIEIPKNKLASSIKKISSLLNTIELNENYFIKIPEIIYETKNKYRLLTVSIIFCIIFIFIFLTALNENIKNSFIILLTIPSSLFLPLLIRILTDTPLNFGDCIGIILLCGIVINSSIYISESHEKSPVQKTINCLQSILITSFTTILSSLPMMIFSSSQFISSLSFFMFFGTFGSIFISLYIFPSLINNMKNYN